jgi:hypothetical protein
MTNRFSAWSALVFSGGVVLCVLGFYSIGGAAPQGGQPPFANSVDQRNEMVRELREIKELLKEQNALLRASAKTNASERPSR